MEKETKQQETAGITYQDIEKMFREEAGSLISEEQIEGILKEEEKKFLHADALEISASCFTGNSAGRYVKGLLRHKQPFSFVYDFLGFMMEVSMMVFFYLLIFAAVKKAGNPEYAFGAKQEFLYPSVWLCCGFLFFRIKAARVGKFLLGCDLRGQSDVEGFSVLEKDKRELQKKAAWMPALPAVCLLAFGSVCCFVIWKWGLSARVQMDVMMAFLIYVAFALLSGLHNVLYGSFFIAYGMIGGLILARKPKEEIENAAAHYKMLCYERMLSRRGKKMEDFLEDRALAEELMQKLHGRMAVYRGGLFFGILIFAVLAGVSLVQMILLGGKITVALCVFALFAVLCLLFFLLAFFSANGVIKSLRSS